MLSKVRLNFKKNCLIYVSKGVIWASEYSLEPQIWGLGGPGAPPWIRYWAWHLHNCTANLQLRNEVHCQELKFMLRSI